MKEMFLFLAILFVGKNREFLENEFSTPFSIFFPASVFLHFLNPQHTSFSPVCSKLPEFFFRGSLSITSRIFCLRLKFFHANFKLLEFIIVIQDFFSASF